LAIENPLPKNRNACTTKGEEENSCNAHASKILRVCAAFSTRPQLRRSRGVAINGLDYA
jgi:hypothetical protein